MSSSREIKADRITLFWMELARSL